jgi:hypothetical protein
MKEREVRQNCPFKFFLCKKLSLSNLSKGKSMFVDVKFATPTPKCVSIRVKYENARAASTQIYTTGSFRAKSANPWRGQNSDSVNFGGLGKDR